MTPIDKVIVFDDLRKYEKDISAELVHCTTNEEFVQELEKSKGLILQVLLDHDLGGIAFGPETSREGFATMLEMHRSGVITIDNVIIVTGNHSGYKWFESELNKNMIPNIYDPFGKNVGLISPKGFGYGN